MADVTALSIYDEARGVYLNDAPAVLYTDAVLLPFLKSSYEDFRNECALNGISEGLRTVLATVAVAAVTIGTLPTDFLLPVELSERLSGSTDLYSSMREVRILPEVMPGPNLNYWSWIDTDVKFVGATTARQVKMVYYWDFSPDAVTSADTDLRANGRAFLSAKLSAKVQMFQKQAVTEANATNNHAEEQLRKIIGIMIRNRQGVPVRQHPFSRGGRRW